MTFILNRGLASRHASICAVRYVRLKVSVQIFQYEIDTSKRKLNSGYLFIKTFYSMTQFGPLS